MIIRSKRYLVARVAALGLSCVCTALMGAPKGDIMPPAQRKDLLSTALRVAEASGPAALPTDLVNLFNPTAFGQPDADELRAIAAAQAAEAAAANKSKPANDSDLLERIAEKIVPSGTLTMNGEPLLIFSQKKVRVGDRLTVTYDGHDYSIELTAIQRFTFTLRLNRAEITRRINPGKNP
jgi:hypothetical protein